MSFDLGEADAEASTAKPADTGKKDVGADAGSNVIGDLAEPDSAAAAPAAAPTNVKETTEEIYAVQQVYALRLRRVELTPFFGITLNDPYVSHPSVGVALNYWFTNVLAVGANFSWYEGFENESDLNFHVRRSLRVAVPINEYQLNAHLNFTYVPFYGKFSAFNRGIFQWDSYLVGGIGMMRTRPISIIDPEVRNFAWGNRLAFNVGLGIRVFVTRWLAIFGEVRDYMYLEKQENTQIALGEDRFNSSTWYSGSPSFVNNVTVQVGASIFFPFKVSYKLPK